MSDDTPVSNDPAGTGKELLDQLGADPPTTGGTYGGHVNTLGGNESGSIVMGGFAEGSILGGGKRRKAKSKGRKKSRSRSKKGGAHRRRSKTRK